MGEPNDAYAKYFVGKSYLKRLTTPQDGVPMANVTFEPGARNNWHIHHAKQGGGQILICVEGEGWYQEEGKEPVSLKKVTLLRLNQKLNIGMELKRTAGLAILVLKFQALKLAMTSRNQLTMKNLINFHN